MSRGLFRLVGVRSGCWVVRVTQVAQCQCLAKVINDYNSLKLR
jgi:hypothetical protein